MNRLNKDFLKNGNIPSDIKIGSLEELPERVLQFGEGNFLRGYLDWMFHRMNEKGLFQGKIAVVQPRGNNNIKLLNDQDALYTLLLRGLQNGKIIQSKEIISCLSRGIDILSGFEEYLLLADNPQLRIIVSNTTEAGISYNPEDKFSDAPPVSFPARLTLLLYRRFITFKGDSTKGFIVLPCELIEQNGDTLKGLVIRYATVWGLDDAFIAWVDKSNYFLNTLVDRIVTGYPTDEAEFLVNELGYEDRLIDAGEIFHLLVIEGDNSLEAELPFAQAGLNVIWAKDITPYRTRKVRILNGAHTMTALAAYLYGKDTVKECVDDSLIKSFMLKGIYREIIPTLDLPENELEDFAHAVIERFANPFIKHYLLSISLNSVSKFKTRVLPSIIEYIERKNSLPENLTFSFAALIAFYRGTEFRDNKLIGHRFGSEYAISDEKPVLELFKTLWEQFDGTYDGTELLVSRVLSHNELWGQDLNNIEGLPLRIAQYLYEIVTIGIGDVLKQNILDAKNKFYKIAANDNVAVALEDVKKGETICFGDTCITAGEDIDKGHKMAIKTIAENENVIKYGFPIGHAVKPIAAGEYIHTHNIKTNLKGLLEYTYSPALKTIESGLPAQGFMGYARSDGSVGIRNEIWIINTVGCVNKISEMLAKEANAKFEGLTDGIFSFSHPYGCSQMGEDLSATQKILASMVNHPNAAGVLVLGLGCENNNIPEFKKHIGATDEKRVKFLTVQDVEDELEEGLKLISELVSYASTFKREKCSVSKLTVGLKCGGSDAFSGITANPLLGTFSDMLIAQGGTSILTEVPEMFGAETLLMDRCSDKQVFDKTVNLINTFKNYFIKHDQEIYENPSPGNKKGGISTLEEKSLGCIQKGGTSNVVDVLDYGDRVKLAGLNLLYGPGNDIVATTALMSSGAQLILFTTGRGTPLGAPVPTIKISSNTQLFEKKKNWIDYDAGQLLTNSEQDFVKTDFYDFVMKVASGEIQTRNEKNGYREIAIFKDGVTL